MSDHCKIANLDNIKGLQELKNRCGTNLVMFHKYLNYVAKEYSSTHFIPTDEFATWYKTVYKKDIDFVNGDPKEIEEAVIAFHKTKQLTVTGAAVVSAKTDGVYNKLYTVPEARIDAMRYIADTIIFLDNNYFVTSKFKDKKFYTYYLNNAKGLAYDFIEHSNLTTRNKKQAMRSISESTNIKEIKKVFAEHGLIFKVNTNRRSKRFYKNRALQAIRPVVISKINDILNTDITDQFDKLSQFEIISLLENSENKDVIPDSTRNFIAMYYELKEDDLAYLQRLLLERVEDILGREFVKSREGISKDKLIELLENQKTKDIPQSVIDLIDRYYDRKTQETNRNRANFFDTIINNGYLDSINFFDEKTLDEQETIKRVSEEVAQNTNDVTFDLNDYNYGDVVAAYEHSGFIKNALDHVDPGVKNHLASIKKLNSTNLINGLPDYDRNNNLGVPQGIDIHKAYGFLYNKVNYESPKTMIASIRTIAEAHPDMRGFHTLANDLDSNEDLCNMYWTTFAKIVIPKIITKTSPDEKQSYISNKDCNAKTMFINQLLNTIRYTSYTVLNSNEDLSKVDYYKNLITDNTYKALLNSQEPNADKTNLINKIIELVRTYYPCVKPEVLKIYIETKNKDVTLNYVTNNINKLLNILGDVIIETGKTYSAYKKETDYHYKITAFNNRLSNLIDKIYNIRKRNKNDKNITKLQIENELKNLNSDDGFAYVKRYVRFGSAKQAELYKLNSYKHIDLEPVTIDDYTTSELKQKTRVMANELFDYSMPDVELNAVNAERNQVSAVINSSYLTNMMLILSNDNLLSLYGKHKAKFSQYKYSHLLFEHLEDNSNKKTYGLFKWKNGEIVPTDYAKELIKIASYDGAFDETSGKAALYYKMTNGDYVGSGFINFFYSERNKDNNIDQGVGVSDYFMRIPADAKNNFVVSAPRYDITGLYNVMNYTTIKNEINAQIDKLPIATEEDKTSVANPKVVMVFDNKNDFIDFITSKKSNKRINKRLPNHILNNHKDGDVITVQCQYKENNDSQDNVFILKGTIKNNSLTNTEFVGLNSALSNDIRSSLFTLAFNTLDVKGKIVRQFNPNHVLFSSLKRAFKQEILDMAVAIDTIFETWSNSEDPDKQGLIKCYNEDDERNGVGIAGQPIFREGKSNVGNTNPGCYQNYHYKDGVIIGNKNGKEYLTGNVFKSNRFTIADPNIGNLGNKFIEKHFDLLYGEGNTFIKTIKENDRVVDVDLSALDSAINEFISEFISAYVKNSLNRIAVYTQSLKDININFDTVGEYFLNYHLTYISFDDLFEGNSKIYQSDQTSFKRAKEVQGSGNPYGLLDFSTIFTRTYSEIDSILDTEPFKHWGVRQHNQYRGVTIYNTKTTDTNIGEFNLDSKGNPESFKTIGVVSQQLIDQLVKEGFNKDAAIKHAFEITSRWYNPKVNDAQSYITFNEFIRRIARRGQLHRYKPLIDKIMSGEPLLGEELNEFIQVQKNFQYDHYIDEEAQGCFSRQIKNAEFVLVPQLIKGTELETLAKLMDIYGIDQLNTEETSKAGKSVILEVFDKKTGFLRQDIIDEIENNGEVSEFGKAIFSKKARQYYNYEFLFTQQETQQHGYAYNKAGLQIMKKIIDNIDETNKDLYPIKELFTEYYIRNIFESAIDYYKKFGIDLKDKGFNVVLNENTGNYSLDDLNLEDFYRIYREELRRRKDDPNLLDFARLEDIGIEGVKTPVLPDFLTLTAKTLEQVAQSMVNHNIVRQELPGFHGPQITSVGFNSKNLKTLLQEATGDSNVKVEYDKQNKLQFYPEGKPYIEVMVPASFFGLERRHADGTLKTKQELLDELAAAKGNSDFSADTFIGYRVPTEAKYSIAVMKVVDFVDDAYGSTIVVPHAWVAQTGSDFDVDSIYGIMANTKINKNGILEKIDEGFDNKNGRDNGILNCMLKIMQHPSTLEERLLTSTTSHIGAAIDAVVDPTVKLAKQNRSQYNFLDQVDNHDDAISGAELKAISVAWDGFISIANSVGMYLPQDQYVEINGHKLIQFGDNSENNHRNYSGHLLTAYSAETSPYEFDAIKSGAIPNINTFTFNVFKFLSGMGCDYTTNLDFMTTPAVTRLVNINNQYNSIYSNTSPNIITKAIEEIAKELNVDTRNLTKTQILNEIATKYNWTFNDYSENKKVVLTSEQIKRSKETHKKANESNDKSNVIHLLLELQDVLTYEQLQTIANTFSELSMVLRGDKISAKQSIYETEEILEKCLELANNDLITTVDGVNIIDAIFPGLINSDNSLYGKPKRIDIVNFLNEDRTKDSKYKVLYTFMKYATIPSILINKQLFSTQREVFSIIDRFVRRFNVDNRRLTSETKERLIKYCVSKVYHNIMLDADPNIAQQELSRLHGYKLITNDFNISDINNPTEGEIEEFKKLSPGEQIIFLQNNIIGDNIFNLLQVDIKPYKSKGHRITFNSISNDINLARRLFSEAFFDESPLINIAARNIFKYGFLVEGYSMRKHGVSNIISGIENICLKEYVSELSAEFNSLYNLGNDVNFQELAINFVRGNSDLLQLPRHIVQNNSKNIPELNRFKNVITVLDNEDNEGIIKKYSIKDNAIIKLKFKDNNDYVLYHCVKIFNNGASTYVLYPLNKLEPFEHTEFSINDRYWQYPARSKFNELIFKFQTSDAFLAPTVVSDIIAKTEELQGKTKIVYVPSKNKNNKSFDVNNPTENLYGTCNLIKDKARALLANENFDAKEFGIFPALDNYIVKEGLYNGELQSIIVNEGTENEHTEDFIVYKLDKADTKNIARYVQRGKPVKSTVKNSEIINSLIEDYGIKFLNENIYIIAHPPTIDENGLKHSYIRETSAEIVAEESYRTVRRIARSGNTMAEQITNFWEDIGITYNKESIASNIDIILKKTAPMFDMFVRDLNIKIKNFYKNPDTGEWYSIADPRLAPELASDENLEREFLETLNLIKSLEDSNSAIITLNIVGYGEIEAALKTIHDSILSLRDNITVIEAVKMYANDVLAKRSTNPLINQDIIDIFSPHYSTNYMNSWFSDMLETSNPFAQVLLKQVTNDIYKKDLAAEKHKKEFLKYVKDLIAKANQNGKNIDINKFITDDGVIIQQYNEQLSEDLTKLRTEYKEWFKKYEQASNYVDKHNCYKEYLKAKLRYKKFLIDHVEQPVIKEYYEKRYKLEHDILYGPSNKPKKRNFLNPVEEERSDIFVQYCILKDKQFELYDLKRKGTLTEEQHQELEELEKEMKSLTAPPAFDYYDDEVFIEPGKPVTKEDIIKNKINNIYARRKLIDYINEYNKINEQYFKYDPEFNFDKELERNLRIIENRELRDANGNISRPMIELMEDEEYVKAKTWMKEYTLFIPDEKTEQRKQKAFSVLRGRSKTPMYNSLVADKKAKDYKGEVDGRVFTDEEINTIREEQKSQQIYNEDNPLSDNIMINFAKRSNIVYTLDFYLGLTSNGNISAEWLATAKRINELLLPFYNETVGGINWREMGNTTESRAVLRELGVLYRKLDGLKKRKDGTDSEKVKEFIEKYVQTSMNKEEVDEFKRQETIARSLGADFYNAWKEVSILDNGKINPYLYSSFKPNKLGEKQFIDRERTEALQILDELYSEDYTEYYYMKYREMKDKGDEAFDEWYKANHIYDFKKKRMTPIKCWVSYQYKPSVKSTLTYVPKRSKTTKNIKPEYVNPNHIVKASNELNYIKGTGYDNTLLQELNEYEIELKNTINALLHSLVKSKRDHRYIDKGFLPYQRKAKDADAKFWAEEILATFGWKVNNTGTDLFEDIDYVKNDRINTPMLTLLDQVKPRDINLIKPEKNENESETDFEKRVTEYEKALNKLKQENKQRHTNVINKDWINVIAEFISTVGHFNAVQDNRELLFYGKHILDDYKVYVQKYGFFGDYKQDRHGYVTKTDENIAKQYENYVRRLLLNQWKESNEKVTKWASILQNITSAQYMMMNIRGGIANVTLGQTQVAAEAVASSMFDYKDWLKSEALYAASIPSFALHLFDDKADTVVGALINTANIIDYDEVTGKAKIIENPTSKAFGFFNKAMYSPQSIGEHYMQNRVLISAFLSHKVYVEQDPITGKNIVVFKNQGEVIQDCAKTALLSVLTDSERQRFNEMIDSIRKDPNITKDFAWYKDDVIYQFAKSLSKERKKEYLKVREELEKKELKDFNNPELHPTALSQFGLSADKTLEVKPGSILSQYDVQPTSIIDNIDKDSSGYVTDAMTAFAKLRNRVISINKKIHGVYDKLGQAQIERKWFGGLVMQYHKHLPIGINKRYRKEGYYNEMRGTIEKGSYVSLTQFLTTPFRKNRILLELSETEANTLEGIKNIFKATIDFVTHINLYWNMLPSHEQANIRRNFGDVSGLLLGILLSIVIKSIGDDDDEDNVLYNLALYEIDRLHSEAGQFTPPGAINQFKKLWSAPIAAQSGVSDLFQTMDIIAHMIFGDDDFNPYFETGRFAGQHKLKVYLTRRIPIVRGIKTAFFDITEQNSYYKLKQNVGGDLVNDILSWTLDEE